MQQASVQAIVEALNKAGVRYLIAGGLAVVAHGYVRFTADVDLILDLDRNNVEEALKALSELGYRPRAPVPMTQFAVPEIREKWIAEKGLVVFTLHSPIHMLTEVDLFVRSPLDFEAAYKNAYSYDVGPNVAGTFLGTKELLDLKQKAGRPKDLEDIDELRRLYGPS